MRNKKAKALRRAAALNPTREVKHVKAIPCIDVRTSPEARKRINGIIKEQNGNRSAYIPAKVGFLGHKY